MRNLEQGRIWSLLTTAVSVDSGWGLLFNGFTLYFLGNGVAQTIGTKYFLPLYFGGAVAAGLAHVGYNYYTLTSETSSVRRVYSKHASYNGSGAAIMAVAACYAAMFPTRSIMLYGVLPVPAAVLVGGFMAFSVYNCALKKNPHSEPQNQTFFQSSTNVTSTKDNRSNQQTFDL